MVATLCLVALFYIGGGIADRAGLPCAATLVVPMNAQVALYGSSYGAVGVVNGECFCCR